MHATGGVKSGHLKIMKHTTVKISEIAAHPTLRMDAGYWLKKKKIGPGRVGPIGRKSQVKKKK